MGLLEKISGLSGRTVLGVNPPVFDFAWFDLWSKPVGLLNILGHLRARGNQVFLVDSLYEAREKALSGGRWKVRRERLPKPDAYRDIPRHYHRFGLSPEELRLRLMAAPRPDLILLTSIMTYWYPAVFETVRILREVFPNVPIVLGGIYATLCPEHAAGSGADYVIGPGEASPRPAVLPLDLYDRPEYGVAATSYGCPMRCQYCASSILSPVFQPRPLQDIFADLAGQAASGPVRDFAFYDDALLWEREKRFYPLCEHIQATYPDLNFHTPNGLSVAMLDQKCCRLMRQTGFRTLRLSLEGIDAYTNSVGSDKSGPQSYGEAVANLTAAGYQPEDVETYILAGLPGQNIDDIERSIDFVKSLGGRPKLCEFSPIPGTRLYNEALKSDPLLATEPLWHNNTVYASYLSGRIPPSKLQALKSQTGTGPKAIA
ncbi:B12-binding domain-containing radical SAM protein [Deltaproteobacteria bacterium Smac51]|nr:B12-binding domain-containing radical SAM protein [Deltaproteobacteria bacterium Smac51]